VVSIYLLISDDNVRSIEAQQDELSLKIDDKIFELEQISNPWMTYLDKTSESMKKFILKSNRN
jgi:hypothetical protein